MAALTLQTLDRNGFGLGTVFEKKDSAVTSGYKAYLIPNEVKEGVGVHVTINSAGNFNVAYLLDTLQAMEGDTYETPIDAFGAAQTSAVDVRLSPLVRAVVVTLNSGSIDIVVRAK